MRTAGWALLFAACFLTAAAARSPLEPGRSLLADGDGDGEGERHDGLLHHYNPDARGWSNFDHQGYAEAANAQGLVCPAGQVDCHFRGECIDLQTNPLYCGDCSIVCDFNVQTCEGGVCTCMKSAPPCPARGNKCLSPDVCASVTNGGV